MEFEVYNERCQLVAKFVHAEDAAVFIGGQDEYSVRDPGGRMLWWEGHETDSAAESFDGAAAVMWQRQGKVAS